MLFPFILVAIDDIMMAVLNEPLVCISINKILVDDQSQFVEPRHNLENIQILLHFLATFRVQSQQSVPLLPTTDHLAARYIVVEQKEELFGVPQVYVLVLLCVVFELRFLQFVR